ncbi:two-component sensor histidine kinase [Actinocatenispora thailandica]|uniref:histidine kinase n=1 Tax=Actinocatenispora thailandica TaxID=227318 RepID=A0A7R7DVK3_9ACTN|nr:sensor histidine kinase [Actinocatenispora thailandica]BCJ38471.1 two-component sensor histidine kinase [Actinocatenispora thailandica]
MDTVVAARLPRPSRTDLVLAAGFTAAVVVGALLVAGGQDRYRPLDVAGVLLIGLAAGTTVGWHRAAPLWSLGAATVLVNGYLLAGFPYGPVLLCLVIAVFEVARQQPLRRSALACGIAAAISSGTMLVRLLTDGGASPLLAVVWATWIALPWSLGALVHVADAARRRSRADLVARAALQERARLAGEVHDIAGHAFALITMQAGVAMLVFDEQPEQARRSLAAVQETSGTALAELRRMLDSLHPRPGAATDPAGVPGLGDLVRRVRAGGLPVEVTVDGDRPVPGSLAGGVYRVVQEALTNVLRHAGPTTARVSVRTTPAELVVEVADQGAGIAGPPGRGLTVMRRRVDQLGGELTAGPYEDGFRVVARLPMPAAER